MTNRVPPTCADALLSLDLEAIGRLVRQMTLEAVAADFGARAEQGGSRSDVRDVDTAIVDAEQVS